MEGHFRQSEQTMQSPITKKEYDTLKAFKNNVSVAEGRSSKS